MIVQHLSLFPPHPVQPPPARPQLHPTAHPSLPPAAHQAAAAQGLCLRQRPTPGRRGETGMRPDAGTACQAAGRRLRRRSSHGRGCCRSTTGTTTMQQQQRQQQHPEHCGTSRPPCDTHLRVAGQDLLDEGAAAARHTHDKDGAQTWGVAEAGLPPHQRRVKSVPWVGGAWLGGLRGKGGGCGGRR